MCHDCLSPWSSVDEMSTTPVLFSSRLAFHVQRFVSFPAVHSLKCLPASECVRIASMAASLPVPALIFSRFAVNSYMADSTKQPLDKIEEGETKFSLCITLSHSGTSLAWCRRITALSCCKVLILLILLSCGNCEIDTDRGRRRTQMRARLSTFHA